MERVHGPVMLDAATRPPFRVRHYARMLADLHRRLHEIRAPDWLPQAPVPGDRLVHRDLHPLNVLLSTRGPVVIDWTNASAGAPAFDVADAWVLLKTATIPESGFGRRSSVETSFSDGSCRRLIATRPAKRSPPPSPTA
jgi:aminoglycoside phosphotransferase (APT) family kinase protein